MFSRGAGFVYIKQLYSHVGVKNSIWYLINDELIISCYKELTLSDSVKLEKLKKNSTILLKNIRNVIN